MTSKQHIHETFANITRNQKYQISDIANELARFRDNYKYGLERSYQDTLRSIENNLPLDNSNCVLSEAFTEAHNALLVVQSWQILGVQEVSLNPTKNMQHQILARAEWDDSQGKYSPEDYKKNCIWANKR